MAIPGNILRRSASPQAADSRGSILILCLWAVTLLSFFAVTLGYQVRQKITFVRRIDARQELRLIAEAGVRTAASVLLREEPKDYDVTTDPWSNDVAAFKDMIIGSGYASVCYNYFDDSSGTTLKRYGMTDEESRVNLNKADHVMIERLLRALDFSDMDAQGLSTSIEDWRDKDSFYAAPSGGAEDKEYEHMRHGYGAKDSDFEVFDELLLVMGLDRKIYDRLKDYVTIYGSGLININTASRPVLAALGIGGDLIDKIVKFRAGKDGMLGTADDNVFMQTATIVDTLGREYKLGDAVSTKLLAVADQQMTVSSTAFRVSSESRLKDARQSATTTAVIDRKGNILYWQEL